jgi:hypothetical protein
MNTRHLYEIWQSSGQGTVRGPRFRHLHDALLYVTEHIAEASFAVRSPDGDWIYSDRRGQCVFPRRGCN